MTEAGACCARSSLVHCWTGESAERPWLPERPLPVQGVSLCILPEHGPGVSLFLPITPGAGGGKRPQTFPVAVLGRCRSQLWL